MPYAPVAQPQGDPAQPSGLDPAGPDRLARVLRRLRWPALITWLAIAVVLYPVAHSLPGVVNNSAAAELQSSAPSTRALVLQQAAERGEPDVDTATVVFARATELTPADLGAVGAAHAAVARLAAAGHVTGLGAPGLVQRSADGQAAAFSARITTPADNEDSADSAAVQAIRTAIEGPRSRAGDGLQAAVTGSAAVTADTNITNTDSVLLVSLVIIAFILLLIYRSPLLWLPSLLGAVVAYDAAKAAAHGLASAGLTVSSLSVDILTVLVLGVGTDYALLLIHRYREELRHHAATADAMAAALRRTAPVLAASAATVVCAMLCLLAADSASLHGLGPIGAVGIASALVAQLTFLPALLLAFGRAAFWPRIPRPGQPTHEESRLWAGIGARVARRPAGVALAGVLLLGAACAGLTVLHIDNNPVATVAGNPGSVTGAQLLTRHFPVADRDPLTVLIPAGYAAAASGTARATPGVAAVAATAPAGRYAVYDVTLSAPNYSAPAYATIATLRGRLDHAAPGSLVGGDQAIQYDIVQAAHRDDLVLIPLILVVIAAVIALLLRALVAPLVLVATTALSFGASFGLAALLWRYGLGYPGIEAQIPLYIFVFLIALGVDYNIFLVARVREEARHADIRRATLRGLAVTGGVITAAGIVLAAAFTNLSRLPYIPVTEVGSAVAIGVLIDTLLARTVLVPASMLAIGSRVWWPARSVSRDRGPGPRPVDAVLDTASPDP
jgi:putative drug exporter of the RND superfamily